MKKERHFDIISRPLLTEKSTAANDADKQVYLFEVALNSKKQEIKEAVENIFEVKVDSINTVVVRGKVKRVGRIMGKRNNWKKAYITLKEGYSINLVEGV